MHDIAQICINGHLINSSSTKYPGCNKKYCSDCSAEVIDKCPECKFPLQGEIHDDGLFLPMNIGIPKYCPNCGKPYPWTKAKLDALNEMIDLVDELNYDEKNELKKSGELISTDNPRSQIAVYKIKKYMNKVGSSLGEKLQELFVDIASETAIKTMKESGILPK